MKRIWFSVSANLVLDKMNPTNLCGGRVVGGGGRGRRREGEEEDLELGATPDAGAGGRPSQGSSQGPAGGEGC